MNNLEARIKDLIEKLKQERNELKVKIHLGKLDFDDELKNVNHKIASLEKKARELGGVGSEASKDIMVAAKLLGEEIRDGFKKIAERL